MLKEKYQHWMQLINQRIDNYLEAMDHDDLTNLIHQYIGYRQLLWAIPTSLWLINFVLTLVPLHTLNALPAMYLLAVIGCIALVISICVNRMLINFTTRREDKDQDERISILEKQKKEMDCQAVAIFGGIAGLVISFTVIPYFNYLMDHPNKGITSQQVHLLLGTGFLTNFSLFLLPVMVSLFIYSLIVNDQNTNRREIEDWMRNNEYHNAKIHDVLSGGKKAAHIPSMVLGQSLETGDNVVQSVAARRQNTVVYGPIGSGKSSRFFLPQILQDIKHYLAYIRDYPKASKDPTWLKPYGLAAQYLNGFNLIDPTNDLCREVYDLCMKMGVPKDKVIWLDPENKNTPSMNLLRGPVEKAAENVANIINGLKGGNNDFFQQSERTHLKNMVYLLKLTSVIDNKIASFSDLMDMYNDVELVWDKVQILDTYCEAILTKTDQAKEKMEDHPGDQNVKSHYLELKDKYAVAWQTDQWFHNNIQVATLGRNVIKYKSGPHQGQVKHIDAQAEFVHGLTNILDDISKNVPLRRVLFRDSGDFNLDDFLRNGGILLCSTAKAAVGDQLAEILGQVYTLSFQAATFRRKPNCEPMHPLYGDEFPDYLSEGFKEYAAQARKYNVPIIIAAQSPAQLSYKYGNSYFNTLMDVMLTRCTFGDLGSSDAELLSPLFGEHTQTTFTSNKQEIQLSAGQTTNRNMVGSRKEVVPNITASQIMSLEKFTIAVRTPGQHSSSMFNRIRVKLIDSESLKDRFSMSNSADRHAYEVMQADRSFDNPDFDEVDKEIMSDKSLIEEAQEHLTQAKENEEADSEDDSKSAEGYDPEASHFQGKTHKVFETKSKVKEKTEGKKKRTPGFTMAGVPNTQHEKLPFKRVTSPEQAREIADAAMRDKREKKLNVLASADQGIGTPRKKKVPTTEGHTDGQAPSKTFNPESSLKHPERPSEPFNDSGKGNDQAPSKTISERQRSNHKEEDSMMYTDRQGKVKTDHKDRDKIQEKFDQRKKKQQEQYKKMALESLMSRIKAITSDPNSGTSKKIAELKLLRNQVYEDLQPLFPNHIDEIMAQTINKALHREQVRQQTHQSTMSKADDYYTSRRKAIDTGKRQDFQDDFQSVMSQMDDTDNQSR